MKFFELVVTDYCKMHLYRMFFLLIALLSVTQDISGMFEDAHVFDQDLSLVSFDTSNIRNFDRTFANALNLLSTHQSFDFTESCRACISYRC